MKQSERLKKIYDFSNFGTNSKKKQLLTFLLAIINEEQQKQIIDYFNL